MMWKLFGKLFGGGEAGDSVIRGDAYQLVEGDNEEAFTSIREGVTLRRVEDRAMRPLSAFSEGHVIFVTAWDTHSTECLQAMAQDAKKLGPDKLAVVFFQETLDEVSMRNNTWYYPLAHVLESESWHVAEQIKRVPIIVEVDLTGDVSSIIEGLT